MKINLNQQATVTLTQRGADILNAENKKWNDYFKSINVNAEHRSKIDYQAGEIYRNQLWCLFQTFGGEQISLGCMSFADCCEIDVEEWK